ncbi:MAG: DNA polymerase III subunit beta [Bacilli bacterium]
MKFSINKEILLEGLNNVSKALSSKTLIPVLNGIKFILKKEGLYLIGSDSDITIQTFIEKDKYINSVEKEGAIILQGKYIVEIIRKLPNEIINIEVIDGLKTLISTKNTEFNLNGIDPNEYPNIKFEENKNPILLNKKVFKNIIMQTSFSISTQETRPLLTGINFKISKNIMECIATDSYRLSKKIVNLNKNYDDLINIIVPGKNLLELFKILDEEDNNIEIHIFNNKILFKFDNILFQTRLLNGTYPDTSKLIPEKFSIEIICNTEEFYNVIDRASLLMNDRDKNIVKLETKDNMIIISSNAPEIGKVEERLDINKKEKNNIKISFSARYMMEAIKSIKSEQIKILLNGEIKPIIIKSLDDNNLIQLILPIKTY